MNLMKFNFGSLEIISRRILLIVDIRVLLADLTVKGI